MADSKQHELARELRLPDLVLLQVLLIVGLPWIGYAAKLGGSPVWLWAAAIAFFYSRSPARSSCSAAACRSQAGCSVGEKRRLAVRRIPHHKCSGR